MDNPPAPEILFIIIHGTASRGARWTLPRSKIRRRLERHFNRRGRTFSFEWSGDNTNVARLTAAAELARRILALHEEYHAPIYLVAHSHGGNIALYAMRDPAIEERVAGVICMGTLFVRCRQRAFIPALERWLGLLPRFAGVMSLGCIGLMESGVTGWGRAGSFSDWLACGTILLLGGLALSRRRWMPWYNRACGLWVNKFRASIQSRSDAIIANLSLPRLPNLKVFCVSSPHDEASKILRAGIFVAETPFIAWRFLDKLCGPLIGDGSGLGSVLALAFYAGVGVAFAGTLFRDKAAGWLHWLALLIIPRWGGLAVIMIMAVLILPWHLLLAMIVKLPGFLSHGLNGESIFDDWITQMTVEPAPAGPKDCLVKEINVLPGKLNFRARNLRTFMAVTAHTRLYNSPKVLTEIMRWIYKQEGERGHPAGQQMRG